MGKGLERKTHQTIKKVTDDIEKRFHFNTAISAVMELVNEIYLVLDKREISLEVLNEAVRIVVILLSPFVPHIAEELWEMLGEKPGLVKRAWPIFDKSLLVEELITFPVQINGKLRSKVSVPPEITEDALKEKVLADKKLQNYLKDLAVKRWVVIPNKLVNIVTE